MKCLEFRTSELVFPARGEITDAMYLESLHEGAPMHETMGLCGVCGLCIMGSPYTLGGHEPVGLILLCALGYLLLCNLHSVRPILASCVAVGSFGSFL